MLHYSSGIVPACHGGIDFLRFWLALESPDDFVIACMISDTGQAAMLDAEAQPPAVSARRIGETRTNTELFSGPGIRNGYAISFGLNYEEAK